MTAGTEPTWKRWLDRLLMLNVLVVFLGAGTVSSDGFLSTALATLIHSSDQPAHHGGCFERDRQLVAAARAEARVG
jgi:hypothetical protein